MLPSNPVKQAFTENDGVSWCLVRLIGGIAVVPMIYKFVMATVPDYSGFGLGIAAICGAIAAKNFTEQRTSGLP